MLRTKFYKFFRKFYDFVVKALIRLHDSTPGVTDIFYDVMHYTPLNKELDKMKSDYKDVEKRLISLSYVPLSKVAPDIKLGEDQKDKISIITEILSKKTNKQDKQAELEKGLILIDNLYNPERLVELTDVEKQVIFDSKEKALEYAKKILSSPNSKYGEFITPDLLFALSLNVLTKMLTNLPQVREVQYSGLVRNIAEHLTPQIAWQNMDLKKTTEGNKNCDCPKKLAAKFIDTLESSGVITITSTKKDKTNKIVTLVNEWLMLARKEREKLNDAPMICQPLKWHLKCLEGEQKLVGGGYVRNKGVENITTSLLGSTDKIFKTNHSKMSQDNLNYLQSIPYKIDKELLEIAKLRFHQIPKYKNAFDDIELELKLSSSTLRENTKSYRVMQQVKHILNTLETLKDTPIYFPLSHNTKGSIYPVSSQVSPTNIDFVGSLIQCDKEYKISTIGHAKVWRNLLDILADRLNIEVKDFKKDSTKWADRLSENKTIKDFSLYKLIKLYNRRTTYTRALIRLNNKDFGFHLISILCHYQKGLDITNFFKSNLNEEIDIYQNIHQYVINKQPIMRLMDRSLYKDIIRKLSRGESSASVKDDIRYYFFTIDFIKSRKEESMRKLGFSREEIKIKIPSDLNIANMYVEAINEEFPGLKLLRKHIINVVKTRTKLNLPVNLVVSPVFQTTQYYNLDRPTTYGYTDTKGQIKRASMVTPKSVQGDAFMTVPNLHKMKRLALKNFIDYLYSWLIQEVISNCREKNIPIFVAYSTFYVRLVDMDDIKKFYFEAFMKIHRTRPWKHFLESNFIKDHEIRHTLTSEEQTIIARFNESLEVDAYQVEHNYPEFVNGKMSEKILK